MSGHSKWSQIKHKKALTDAKKGKIFSKLARIITLAAREKGGDPAKNSGLRLAIEKAKSMNMPSENIERAIKRGIGKIEGIKMEKIVYEAYGPGGIALILEGITDNKNRTIPEVKRILSQNGGKLAEGGSVIWMFDKKGAIEVKLSESPFKTQEELEMAVIDSGAEDMHWRAPTPNFDIGGREEDILEIYMPIEKLEEIKKNLEKQGVKIGSSSLDWVPKNPIVIDDQKAKEQIDKLFESLDEYEDINEIYSNLAE